MLTSNTVRLDQRHSLINSISHVISHVITGVRASVIFIARIALKPFMPSATVIASEPTAEDLPAESSHIVIDTVLVARLRSGDNDAWDEFVETYSPKLFAYLRYKLPTREDAEDVLNETFGAAVRAIQGFDWRASLLTWLAAIARNKIANYYKAMPEPAEPEEMAQNMPAPVVHFSLEFREALEVIPPHIRQVMLLRYRQGFNVSEVAELTGRSYKSAESLLSRGRALLAALLS